MEPITVPRVTIRDLSKIPSDEWLAMRDRPDSEEREIRELIRKAQTPAGS